MATPGFLVRPTGDASPHVVLPTDLGPQPDTLLPLLRLALGVVDHGRADWPATALLLGYLPYQYLALGEDTPWPTWRLDDEGRLQQAIPREFFFEDDLLLDGDHEKIVTSHAEVVPIDDVSEDLWEGQIRFGPGYGVLCDEPLWLPSDFPVPADPDGTPMTFVGQFQASEISDLMPMFTYWLYWSPRTGTFAQLDAHD